jgi:hypothetical protein
MRRLATEQQKKAEEDIERLTKEYSEMSEERRDNDRQMEELKQEASEIERKVRRKFYEVSNLVSRIPRYARPIQHSGLSRELICVDYGFLTRGVNVSRCLSTYARTKRSSMSCLLNIGRCVTKPVCPCPPLIELLLSGFLNLPSSEVYMETLTETLGMEIVSS